MSLGLPALGQEGVLVGRNSYSIPCVCESAGHWVWVSEWLLFFFKEKCLWEVDLPGSC